MTRRARFATETLNTLSHVRAFEYFRMGQASALLVVFFGIVLAVSIVFLRVRRAISIRQQT